MKNEVRELWDTSEKIEEKDVFEVLGDSGRGGVSLDLRTLHTHLEDSAEADISIEALEKKLEELVRRGDVILQKKRETSFYSRKRNSVCLVAREQPDYVLSRYSSCIYDWRNF